MLDKAYVFRYACTKARSGASVPSRKRRKMSKASFSITDYSQENSNFGYTAAELTAGNIVAQTALHDALRAATEDITIGHVSKHQLATILEDDYGVPTAPYAQRELKALVTYQAVTSGALFQLEIPAPALIGNLVAGTDTFDITSTDWAAWVTAFVAVAKSPDDISDSVIVLGAKLVGRNI